MGLSLHCSSLLPAKTHFQGCFSPVFVSLWCKWPCCPSPSVSRLFYLPHFSLTESLRLSFQLYRSLAPTCTTLLSTSDYLSHFASPQECRPLNANLVALSVPRTHRRNTTAHTKMPLYCTCLQNNRKTISQTSLFNCVHLPWIISLNMWE